MPLSAPPDHAAASADLPTSERVVFAGMEASRQPDVTLLLTEAKAVVLHATIATAEVADDLDTVELGEPVEKKVF